MSARAAIRTSLAHGEPRPTDLGGLVFPNKYISLDLIKERIRFARVDSSDPAIVRSQQPRAPLVYHIHYTTLCRDWFVLPQAGLQKEWKYNLDNATTC